jgi:hypothetical protein
MANWKNENFIKCLIMLVSDRAKFDGINMNIVDSSLLPKLDLHVSFMGPSINFIRFVQNQIPI